MSDSTRDDADAAAGRVEALLADLATADAFPGDLQGPVEVIQTHASVVFLVDDEVFKIKKAIDLGFLDYSDPGERRHYCEREVEMNRPWAPGVYLGVLCLRRVDGRWRFVDGTPDGVSLGPDHEWAVHMRRLPDGATMGTRLEEGRLDFSHVRRVARRIAEFHAGADERRAAVTHARFERVAENCRDNFPPLRHVLGDDHAPLVQRMQIATEHALEQAAPTIRARVERGMPRDGHGDLRLEHVYFLEEEPPRDLVIVDRIEFNDRFRLGDPAIDLAFLIMELRAVGRIDLARALQDTYVETLGDRDLDVVMPLFVGYRAAVRAKVQALRSAEGEVAADERARSRARSVALVRVALAALEPPRERPALVLVIGLPGTGKSTVAAVVADVARMQWVRSDVVRKELAGLDPQASGRADVGEGIYTPAMTERTYGECLARARVELERGGRVVVDATFKERDRREDFRALAEHLGVPTVVLNCELAEDEVRRRLAARTDDPSDADFEVYLASRRAYEPPDATEVSVKIDTGDSLEVTRARTLAALEQVELVELVPRDRTTA